MDPSPSSSSSRTTTTTRHQREPAGKTLKELRAEKPVHVRPIANPTNAQTPNKKPFTCSVFKCFQTFLLWANLIVLIYLVFIYTKSLEATFHECACSMGNSVLAARFTTSSTAIARKAVAEPEMDKAPAQQQQQQQSSSKGWMHNGIVYGLIHVAKVAGTEINGMLALKYERVCGNKGYSFDYVEANKRWAKYKADGHHTNFTASNDLPMDFIHKHRKQWGRTSVDIAIMVERGFDDCDYIATEEKSKFWTGLYNKQWKMELHMPCREPLSHLMSSCNFQEFIPHVGKARIFNCSNPNLEYEVKKCSVYLDDRADGAFLNFANANDRLNNGVSMKCFNPIPPQRYVNYMGNFLQEKRIQADYVHVETNNPRNKDLECVWKQSKQWQENLLRIMRQTHFYYQFCNECMGSPNELPLPALAMSSSSKK